MPTKKVRINRAPVLTLWSVVVAEQLGYDEDAALTLGKAVAGLNAQSKGRRLGIFEEKEEEAKDPQKKVTAPGKAGEPVAVSLLGRSVNAVKTEHGLRALDKGQPMSPDSVRRYLKQKFGENLKDVTDAMQVLASAYKADNLATHAYKLYEEFRPEIPEGKTGWGAAGDLDLGRIRSLAK